MAKVKSGRYWVTWANIHARNSTSVEEFVEPFRTNAKAFIKALEDSGAKVVVSATRRSANRAYSFHWCWTIGLGKAKASQATTVPGVDIEWKHGDPEKAGKARKMIDGFSLKLPPKSIYAPALFTKHTPGKAIDMNITWSGTIRVKKKDGGDEWVLFMTDVKKNTKLHAVGASYGVNKLNADAPHWSLDGINFAVWREKAYQGNPLWSDTTIWTTMRSQPALDLRAMRLSIVIVCRVTG